MARVSRYAAEYPCAVDGCHLLAHQHRICNICAGNLTRWLQDMPALLDDLAVTLTRQARIGGHNGGRTSERTLPFDARASEAGDILRSTLVGWVRELHNDADDYPIDSLHGMALWLQLRLPRLLDHPAAEEAVDEIGAAVKLTQHAIDRPTSKVYAGQCLVDGCQAELMAKPTAAVVDCPKCGIRHNVDERRQVMLGELHDMLIPLPEIARWANYFGGFDSRRASKLLGTWETRKRIQPGQTLPTGEKLYPFGELLAMLLAAPTRRRSAA